jgi:hypothetical protein
MYAAAVGGESRVHAEHRPANEPPFSSCAVVRSFIQFLEPNAEESLLLGDIRDAFVATSGDRDNGVASDDAVDDTLGIIMTTQNDDRTVVEPSILAIMVSFTMHRDGHARVI